MDGHERRCVLHITRRTSVAGCRFYSVIVSRTKMHADAEVSIRPPSTIFGHKPLNANDNKRFLNPSND